MWNNSTIWTFQAINKRSLSRENLNAAKKGKPHERNLFSSDSSSKQHYKDYEKTKPEDTQQNSKCRLCGDRYETMNHIINESIKKCITVDMTEWEKLSIRNCARSLIWPYEQMVYAQRGIRPIKWDTEISGEGVEI